MYAGEDGTFENRYDDPAGEYRVLYASTDRIGPFLETLARFRPDPAIARTEIAGDPRDQDFPTALAGQVPVGWLEERLLGTARCDATFADVGRRPIWISATPRSCAETTPDLVAPMELFGLAFA